MKTIAVDIDDTLSASAPALIEYSNKTWGMNLTTNQCSEHWGAMWQVDHEEQKRRSDIIESSRIQATLRHDEHAFHVLNELKKDYRLIILSARPEILHELSREWVTKNYNGVFEEIHFANLWDDRNNLHIAHLLTKADICEELGVDYLIDDQLKHCVGVSERGIASIIFGDYAWNASEALPSNVTRAHTWDEIRHYFTKIGVSA